MHENPVSIIIVKEAVDARGDLERVSMTLNQLRYFCMAARCHSITQAAKSLFVTQPAVSIAIRELEKEFSLTLFTHTKKGLELTTEGEAFYREAAALLAASDEMKAHFSDPALFRPTVSLGIPPMLSTIFFPELMDAFHEKHPDIYLELSEYASMRACSMVQDELLDVGLVNMEVYDIDKFSYHVLAEDRLAFCVVSGHHMADEPGITMEQLDREPLVLFSRDSVQCHLLNTVFRSHGIQPHIILHSSQLITTLKFVRQAKCGCFLFSSMLPALSDVKEVPLTPEIPVKIGLVWKKGKYISSHTQTFISFCKEFYME